MLSLLAFFLPAHSQSMLELLCEGGFQNEKSQKEFQLIIEPSTGFMWGFDPIVSIGFFNIDDKTKPFAKDFKCDVNESNYMCKGKNSVGFSSAELSRYSGKLRIITALKGQKDLLEAEFVCKSTPKKQF
jgi:hypothetical protein